MKKHYMIVLCGLVWSMSISFAQYQFELVKDLKPEGGSSPTNLTVFGGKLYFTAYTVEYGNELWITDGTESGTHLVKDINPGEGLADPRFLTIMQDHLYFLANDGVNGGQVWVTDGTPDGTYAVHYGENEWAQYYLTAFDTFMLFHGQDLPNGVEPWISDGTDNGTHILMDINPGPDYSYAYGFIECNGKIFFLAMDNLNGNELWITDGTLGGTHLVKDINPGTPGSKIYSLTVFNNKLFFKADDGTHGEELWVTDGTTEGTVMFKEFAHGIQGSAPVNLKVVGDKLFFSAFDTTIVGSELWATDGTPEGTYLVKNINAFSSSYPESLTEYNGKVYFRADDGILGYELWVSDGTADGTYMVKDTYPGSSGGCSFSKSCVYNGKLYFDAFDGSSNGAQLWVTDGTEAGTYTIEPPDATEAAPLMIPLGFKEYNGSLYFGAMFDERSIELWKMTYDITEGIASVTDPGQEIYPNPATSTINLKNISSDHHYDLYHIDGRILRSGRLEPSGSSVIDVSGLKQGIYILRTNSRSFRFVKQ